MDKDVTEAEEIKKRWQVYKEVVYKKGLNDPDNHNGVVTHVEPDILECEVKWALGRITTSKASGGDRILAELFQILKDAAVKSAALSTSANLQNSTVALGVFILISKKGNAKECLKYHTTALISHSNKVMLKICQARLQKYVN